MRDIGGTPTEVQYPKLHDHMWLLEKYWQERKNTYEIADIVGCSQGAVLKALEREMIPKRGRGGRGEQYPKLHDREWLHEKYREEGKNTHEIADILGCCHQTVREALKREGIPIRKGRGKSYPKLNDREWLVEKYWEERKSSSEIADTLGCYHTSVLRALKRKGIPTREVGAGNDGQRPDENGE